MNPLRNLLGVFLILIVGVTAGILIVNREKRLNGPSLEPPAHPVPMAHRFYPAAPAVPSDDLADILLRDARRYLARDYDPRRDRSLSAEEEAAIPPLIAAVNRRQSKKVLELLAGGADVNTEWRGTRAVYIALDNFRVGNELLDILLKARVKKDVLVAAAVGGEEELRAALGLGEGRDARTPLRKSPLHMAVHFERPWAVRLLLDSGFTPDPLDYFAKSPLAWSMQGPPEISMILIEKGADIHRRDNLQQAPLYYAVSYGKTSVVARLLALGASVNTPGQQGFSPLHMAAQTGQEELARMLIQKGADVNARDVHGKTPLAWARKYDKPALAEILVSAGAKE